MDPQVNPFADLSLIAAPAILTRSIYLALGSFAFATLISLVGAVLVPIAASGGRRPS